MLIGNNLCSVLAVSLYVVCSSLLLVFYLCISGQRLVLFVSLTVVPLPELMW